MTTNTDMTIYNRELDKTTHSYIWKRNYIEKVMWQENQNTSFNEGLTESKVVKVFIPIEYVGENTFTAGDLIVKGKHSEITKEDELNNRFKVINVLIKDYGSTNIQHIELIGE